MAASKFKDIFFNANGTSHAGAYTKLQASVVEHKYERMMSLLLSGADINKTVDRFTPSPFLLALMNDNSNAADVFLNHQKQECDVNAGYYIRSEGEVVTPLSYFLFNDLPYEQQVYKNSMMEKILKKGGDPYQSLLRFEPLPTPFHIAIDNGDIDAVRLFCTHSKADIKRKFNGETLAHHALEQKQYNILLRIIQTDPKIMQEKNDTGLSVAMVTAAVADEITIRRMFELSEPKLNDVDKSGRGFFHYILSNKNLETDSKISLIRDVLKKDDKAILTTDFNKDSILHCLINDLSTKEGTDLINGLLDVLPEKTVSSLLEKRNAQGITPVFLAVTQYMDRTKSRSKNLYRYVVDSLLEKGADANVEDKLGYRMLDKLAEKDERDSLIVQSLMKADGTYKKLYSPEEMADLKGMLKGENAEYKHMVVKKDKQNPKITIDPRK